MEVVNVYNLFVERKFAHIFKNQNSTYVQEAKEIYTRQYKQVLEKR